MQQRSCLMGIRLALCVLIVMGLNLAPVFARSEGGYEGFIQGGDEDGIAYFAECGQFWPLTVTFRTRSDGRAYSAYLQFHLTREEKAALLCVGEFLEIDFRILGFEDPSTWPFGWEDYSIHTNLPGGIHDTGIGDEKDPVQGMTPAVTGIPVSELEAGHEYFAGIAFTGLALLEDDALGPRVSFEWQPSHWATSEQERRFCATGGLMGTQAEWCIYSTVWVYLSDGYTLRKYGEIQSLVFDGDRTWEIGSAGST